MNEYFDTSIVMIHPTLHKEKELRKNGYQHVCGVDEAGRGAWAGPIVAAAVVLPVDVEIPTLRDSKLLSPRQRDTVYDRIVADAICWNVAAISASYIDTYGIQQANRVAMVLAIAGLAQTDYALIDYIRLTTPIPHEAVRNGDATIGSIAAASILAKVTRDRMMEELHQHFPQYGFDAHRGYGTRQHTQALNEYGCAPIHRRSFGPIRKITHKNG